MSYTKQTVLADIVSRSMMTYNDLHLITAILNSSVRLFQENRDGNYVFSTPEVQNIIKFLESRLSISDH